MGLFDLFRKKKPPETSPSPAAAPFPALCSQPDGPEPFGYKILWLAVRAESPQAAAEALGLRVVGEVCWTQGIELADSRRECVFVSPALDGYILVAGLPAELDVQAIAALSQPFDELLYFACHHIIELQGWARAAHGKLLRGFCYLGERGEILWDVGEMTPKETALGFGRFAVDDDVFEVPDEEDVLQIAAAWSVDTLFEQKFYPPGVGMLCEWIT